MRPSRRRLAGRVLGTTFAAAVAATLATPSGAAVASSSDDVAAYHADGSRPVYSYAGATRETAWVPTGFDEDRDGRIDRVAADIIRPAEPARAGRRIPVIMDTSPYYACCGRGNERQKKTYAADGTPLGFPLYYDNYFVPRGYAVVLVDEAGTNRSTGCPAGRDAVASSTRVIDWLNGRAPAFTTRDGSERVRASWANGRVGMIGKSDDGAQAIDTAVTGVRGLRTIVSIAGVARRYDVFNSDGAWFGSPPFNGNPPGLLNPRAEKLCAPLLARENAAAGESGDFNRYWRRDDAVSKVPRMRASVLATQGFGDLAVSPLQFGRFWAALGAAGIPRKAWLHQAGHVDPFDLRRAEWVRTLHRWFDRWLLGVRNGIDREPAVSLETRPDRWVELRDWPSRAAAHGTLFPRRDGSLGGTQGTGRTVVVDDPAKDRYTWADTPEQPVPYRAVFTTSPARRPVHLSGTGSVTLTVRSSEPTARVGAALVDYGPATVRDNLGPGAGITTGTTRTCWGASRPGDSACYLDTSTATTTVDHEIVAAGWADVGHYHSLRHRVALDPQRYYRITFTLSTLDHVLPRGHRLGLVVGGTDAATFYLPDATPRTLRIDLARSRVDLP